MILSQSAQMCLEATWIRFANRTRRRLTHQERAANATAPIAEAELLVERVAPACDPRGSAAELKPPDSREHRNDPLSPSERRARAAALRGMAFSRQRRFDAAQSAFAVAARLDPELDLTRTPAFWRLERGAHEAAIAAYLDAGREGDATVLRARVQSTYRPRPVRTHSSSQAAH